MKNLKLLLVLLLAIMTSCSKEEIKNEKSNDLSLSRGIYICGANFENGKYVPKYWVNNVPYNLENNGNVGQATSMTYNGNDLYAVGYLYDSAGVNMKHVVWKNNSILYTLTNIGVNYTPFTISISNNDIYVMGIEQDQIAGTMAIPKIWKNGIATNVSNNLRSMSFSFLTKNEDVYVVGCTPVSNTEVAVVWKNGIQTNLSDGTKDAVAKSIFIVNNDVYVVGIERIVSGNNGNFIVKYWKNGVATSITDGSFDADANSISVIGNDIYIGGNEKNANGVYVAKYWKNGMAFNLTDGINHSRLNSFVFSNNLFSVGTESNTAKLWYNNDLQYYADYATWNKVFIIY